MRSYRSSILTTCYHCGGEFRAKVSRLEAGKDRYCGRPCYLASRPLVPVKSLEERFWAKVNKDGPIIRPELGPCWIWTAGRDANGYGHISSNQRGHAPLLAHRVSWFLRYEHWPEPGCLHHCDNPPCVRPDHLFEGDHVANMADCVMKLRHTFGERGTGAKLTETQAIEILTKYVPRRGSQARLAAEYGVHQMTISDLVGGRTWKHLKRS